jgi:hypothetical protein
LTELLLQQVFLMLAAAHTGEISKFLAIVDLPLVLALLTLKSNHLLMQTS